VPRSDDDRVVVAQGVLSYVDLRGEGRPQACRAGSAASPRDSPLDGELPTENLFRGQSAGHGHDATAGVGA
jgi:hypothetical protein